MIETTPTRYKLPCLKFSNWLLNNNNNKVIFLLHSPLTTNVSFIISRIIRIHFLTPPAGGTVNNIITINWQTLYLNRLMLKPQWTFHSLRSSLTYSCHRNWQAKTMPAYSALPVPNTLSFLIVLLMHRLCSGFFTIFADSFLSSRLVCQWQFNVCHPANRTSALKLFENCGPLQWSDCLASCAFDYYVRSGVWQPCADYQENHLSMYVSPKSLAAAHKCIMDLVG